MNIGYLKTQILSDNNVEHILDSLNCGNIKSKGDYITCSNPDGDNPVAVTVYLNDSINVINYTRNLDNNKRSHDIFDLVKFYNGCNFFQAVKYVCECCGYSYYNNGNDDGNIPESLLITQQLLGFTSGNEYEAEQKLQPISENILSYYHNYVNDLFYNDGITYDVQREFEIGYDDETNYITIPVRDELGNLVGIKGRYLGEADEQHSKYTYLKKCPKGKILYGLNKTEEFIAKNNVCYITEAEKGVLQLISYGYYNVVATGGCKITTTQIEKLSRICTHVVFCFDKDVGKDELQEIADKFISYMTVDAIVDNNNILNDKESPTDNKDKFEELIKTSIVRLKSDAGI